MNKAMWAVVEGYANTRSRVWRAFRDAECLADKRCREAKEQAWEEYKRSMVSVEVAYIRDIGQAEGVHAPEEEAG